MSYLFINNQEIKNTQDGPISVALYDAIGNSANTNSPSNPVNAQLNNESMYSADWQLQVSRNKISGVTPINISGYNATLGASVVPIWEAETVYTYPTTNTQMRLYSSSASDTNVSITINGLNSSYAPISETLVLTNGATGVLTVNSYFRIQGIQVTQSSSVNPVGQIYLSNSGKTVTYATILAGVGKSQAGLYTVPAGYTFYLQRVGVYCGSVSQGQTPGNVTYRVATYSPTGILNSLLQTPFTTNYSTTRVTPRAYTEKTDIQWQASSTQTTPVAIQIEGLLIVNTNP
jgi:hypothetical protein